MKIPDEEHWAIVTTSSYTVPGDERSRTHPGHGYPEHTVDTLGYDAYTDFVEFTEALERMARHNTRFRAIHVQPMSVDVTVSVKVK